MPRGDGTGPMGEGPMTGRGAGLCAGNVQPGFAGGQAGRGFGPGFGGRGYRNRVYPTRNQNNISNLSIRGRILQAVYDSRIN